MDLFINLSKKLEMEVQIISRDTIKPSSPTPHHLKTHKLSLLDQLVPPVYIPVLVFYSANSDQNPRKRSNQFKDSLSKTLVQFYTFAGRLNDGFTIDCNDDGVTYVEAQVAIDMAVVLEEPEVDLLRKLLPCDNEDFQEPCSHVVAAIQVNYFACGGTAICVCVHHAVADASALATFLKTWAEAAVNGVNLSDTGTFDCSSLFPQRDLSECWKVIEEKRNLIMAKDIETKRFVFDGSKIAVLRDEIGKVEPYLYRPTRLEAVSALIWQAMTTDTTAEIAENDETIPIYVATSVNLRKRMNLPFPQNCAGNVSQFTMTEPLIHDKTKNLSNLAVKIHESIAKVDNDYVRNLHAGNAYVNIMETAIKGYGKNWMFSFSSWCRFPFYETDFGWGKPIWFATTLNLNRLATFLDTNNGEGIEAWITLNHAEMAKLEQDPGILAYANFKPSI